MPVVYNRTSPDLTRRKTAATQPDAGYAPMHFAAISKTGTFQAIAPRLYTNFPQSNIGRKI